jgi:hypothetical protein
MATAESKSVFNTLSKVNCQEHSEKKGNLSYLSWAWAWTEVKKAYPEAFYTIYENPNGIPYFTDGKTCWVKTGVTINGLEHIEYLPIMDFNNRSIPLDKVTSTDMNKAIQRSLTKACARHGLGLYIYAGEDLPEAEQQPRQHQLQPTPGYQPVEQGVFNRMIENFAHNKPAQSGQDYRTAWITYTNAGEYEIAMFDQAVEAYKKATNIL